MDMYDGLTRFTRWTALATLTGAIMLGGVRDLRAQEIDGLRATAKLAPADGEYRLRNACSGQLLGVRNGTINPWDDAVVQPEGSGLAISWQLASAGDGSHIVRAAGTNSALQSSYGATASGTNIDLWTYLNGAAQRWIINDAGGGYVKLNLAAAPDKALDLKYAGGNGETDVWLYTDNGTCAQQWKIEAVDAGSGNTGDAFAMLKRLGRGINFGNILEASPTEGSWGISLSEELFDKAKEAGFATIRLPVRWSNHAQAEAPFQIDENWFKRVDYAINAALSRGMNIVVNMHHYRQLGGEKLDYGESSVRAGAVEDRFVAMWTQIAARYKDLPNDRVLFELYNEPNTTLTPDRWNPLLARTLSKVRENNPNRFVVIGPTSWNGADALAQLQLPNDPRIIVTIHNYNPFKFTHVGASWAGGDKWPDGQTTCCNAQQIADIVAPLDKAKQWAGTRWPIWVGEFGAFSGEGSTGLKAEYASRVRYTRIVRDEAERRGFAWAYWELAAGFGIWDPNAKAWRTELRDALVGP